MSYSKIIYKLIKISNKLDRKGLYDAADIVDKIAVKYAEDHELDRQRKLDNWEADVTGVFPGTVEKEEEYKEYEIPTDPKEIEELIVRTKMLLKGNEYPEGDTDIWMPNDESEDVGEKWYFGEEGLPEEEPED